MGEGSNGKGSPQCRLEALDFGMPCVHAPPCVVGVGQASPLASTHCVTRASGAFVEGDSFDVIRRRLRRGPEVAIAQEDGVEATRGVELAHEDGVICECRGAGFANDSP